MNKENLAYYYNLNQIFNNTIFNINLYNKLNSDLKIYQDYIKNLKEDIDIQKNIILNEINNNSIHKFNSFEDIIIDIDKFLNFDKIDDNDFVSNKMEVDNNWITNEINNNIIKENNEIDLSNLNLKFDTKDVIHYSYYENNKNNFIINLDPRFYN